MIFFKKERDLHFIGTQNQSNIEYGGERFCYYICNSFGFLQYWPFCSVIKENRITVSGFAFMSESELRWPGNSTSVEKQFCAAYEWRGKSISEVHQKKKERLLTHYNSLYSSDFAVSWKAVFSNLIYKVPVWTGVAVAARAFGRLLYWLCRLVAGLHSLQLQFQYLHW